MTVPSNFRGASDANGDGIRSYQKTHIGLLSLRLMHRFVCMVKVNSMHKSGEHFAPPFSLFTIYTS